MGKRWKKIASLMLSVAMAVTLVPTQFAYAANEDATVRPRVVSEDDGSIGSSLPEKLVYFSFDENVTDGGSAKGKAEGNGATVKADDKKVGGGALSLDGTSYINVTDKDGNNPLIGKDEITISYWSKSTTANHGWAYYLKRNNSANSEPNKDLQNLYYLGILDGGGNSARLEAQRFSRIRGEGALAKNSGTVSNDTWKLVTVVMKEKQTVLYVDGAESNKSGEDQASLTDILVPGSIFYLGKATWGSGEFFKGMIDEFTVYDGALNAEQVGHLYKSVTQAGYTDPGRKATFTENQMSVADMNLGVGETNRAKVSVPYGCSKSNLTYTSADPTVAAVDASGVVRGVKAGTTTISVACHYGADTALTKQMAVKVKSGEEELTPINTYEFEGNLTSKEGNAAKAVQSKRGTENIEKSGKELADKTLAATDYSDDGKSGKAVKMNGGAVNTAAGFGVKLDSNLGSNYTVSVWVKPEKALPDNQQVIFVGYHAPQKWIGVTGYKADDQTVKFWKNDHSGFGTQKDGLKLPAGKWTLLTLSQAGNTASVYANGQLFATRDDMPDALNGDDQSIYLGVNYWDKTFGGLMDNACVYDTALDAAQIAASYLKQAAPEDLVDAFGILNGNQNINKLTEDLSLPAELGGIDITWTSNAPTKLTNAGEVKVKDGSKVTLTAAASVPELGFTWNETFDVTLAKTVTIKHVDEKGNEIRKAETVDWQMGTQYVYTVKDKVLSSETAAYIYDEEKNTADTLKIASVSAENAEIIVRYKTAKIESIDASKLPETVYMIEGNVPILPKTVKGTYVTPEDGTQTAGAGTGAKGKAAPEPIDVPIIWDDYSALKPSKDPHTLNGTVAGHPVSVKLMIFACDEAVEDITAANDNSGYKKVKLKHAYKGIIETEYDIVKSGTIGADSSIAYYDREVAENANAYGENATATRFDGGKFYAQGGDGNGKGEAYPDADKRTVVYDENEVYHVRTQIDTTEVSVTPGKPAEGDKPATSPVINKNGTFRVWVTDPNGVTTELTAGKDGGMTFRKVVTGIIDKAGASRAGFKLLNHKISWQSGYVTRRVEIYVDNAKEKEENAKLLPSQYLSDEAAEGEVSERVQAYAYEPESIYDKDGEECVLQEEESGWFKADGTKLADPAATDVAVAGATITYKAYYKKGAANFAGLKAAITAATKIHTEKTADKIYVQASLDTLKAAIDKAQAVYDTKGKDNEADKAEVEKAITDLNAAKNAEMSLKNYADMSKELTAFYLMTENVNDTAGTAEAGKHNGVVTGNVTFSKEDGAAFPGGDAYKNYVNLPTDIPVTDKMTFSFWAYDQNGGANTFGMGSGKKLSNGKTLDGSTTNAHHFSIYVRGNGKLRAGGGPLGWGAGISEVTDISIDYSKWNLVTCVVEGKNLIVYLNGAMAKEGTTGISLTEAWNANSKERYMFIGNNIYGANGDGDFKGNIKNFRIYNAPLAAGQVKDIYENEINAFLDNAASLLAEELKAQADASGGKYTLTITDSKITLPKKGAQNISVSWKAYDADGKESDAVINAQTGAVTLPASGKTSAATLRATLDFNGVTKEVEIACTVMKLDEATLAARKALGEELDKAEKLKEADYTSASWAIFQKTVEEALAAYNNPTTADALTAQATKLANAMKTDGTGTLVPRGDRTGLDALVKKAEDAIKAAEADRDKYDGAVWKGLEDAIKEAKALSGDVSQKEVDDAESKLQAAFDAFRPKDQSYSKDEADRLAAEADKLLEGKNEYEYDEKAWADMQEALAAVRALTAASTPAEVTAAYKKLEAAMEAFKPKTIDKAALGALADDAKEELGKLSKDDYDPKAWAAVEEALAEVEKLAADADASDEQIRAAYGKLWTALKELKAGTYIPVESVTLSKKSLTLNIGKTATLKATVKPANASSRGLTWKSSKPKVVYVGQDGKVEARAKGTADVTVTAGGRTAACRVTVKVPVKKVKLTANYTAIATGKKATVKASVTPANASNKKVKWAIDKAAKSKKYATISQKGVLKAGKKGAGKTVTVTATAQDGSKKKAAIKIKIMKNAVTKVSLKAKAKNVKAGKKLTIKATVQNTGGKKGSKTANTKLAWSVDKKSKKFASINSKGMLSTKKAGKGKTVTVTAMSTDGTNKKGAIKIKITK